MEYLHSMILSLCQMKLIPFTNAEYQILIDWIIDEDLMLLFAGVGFAFPLTERQLVDYVITYSERELYLMVNETNIPIGYGEIIPQDDESARLGHLIIGNHAQRGKGVGQVLIHLLIEKAKEQLDINRMDLYLLDGNPAAMQCYLKFGFHQIDNDFQITYNDKKYEIIKMSMPL